MTNKAALITGGINGIRLNTVTGFSKAGDYSVLNRLGHHETEIATDLALKQDILSAYIHADMFHTSALKGLWSAALFTFAPFDGLVNNAFIPQTVAHKIFQVKKWQVKTHHIAYNRVMSNKMLNISKVYLLEKFLCKLIKTITREYIQQR